MTDKKNREISRVSISNEGYEKKGGLNKPPRSERPAPPQGQDKPKSEK